MSSVVSFRNRQRTRALSVPLLRRITRYVLESELGVENYELGIHLVEPEEMARVNQQFLGHEGSTDVITFDYSDVGVPPSGGPAEARILRNRLKSELEPLHGEIFISVADAVKQAREFRTTWQSEVVRYVIHGLLHLHGHDDLQPAARKAMKREENRLVKSVALRFALSSLARARKS